MWWTIGLIGINSAGFNYTIFGALLLNLLFFGSTALTEKISCEKYPLYKDYKNTTSMLIPFLKFPSKEAK
jgi:steroid 5-alpha reductase family enzyme